MPIPGSFSSISDFGVHQERDEEVAVEMMRVLDGAHEAVGQGEDAAAHAVAPPAHLPGEPPLVVHDGPAPQGGLACRACCVVIVGCAALLVILVALLASGRLGYHGRLH